MKINFKSAQNFLTILNFETDIFEFQVSKIFEFSQSYSSYIATMIVSFASINLANSLRDLDRGC